MSHRRHWQDQRKFKKLARKASRYWVSGGAWYDEEKRHYVRLYRNEHSKEVKRFCNRRFRRKKLEYLPQGNDYRRYTEFWDEYWDEY